VPVGSHVAKVKARIKPGWGHVDPVVVRLFEGRKRIGHVVMMGRWARSLDDCKAGVEYLVSEGYEANHAWIVSNSHINKEFRGLKLGKFLYMVAFEEAARRSGEPIYVAPTVCVIGSGTSDAARRVWDALSWVYPSPRDGWPVLYVEPSDRLMGEP
jgi:hypothetical protein